MAPPIRTRAVPHRVAAPVRRGVRNETPWFARTRLAADEFIKDGAYKNWRPRGGGDWLLIYTVAGAGQIVARDGMAMLLEPGDALLYAPGEYHDYSTDPATGEWRLLWVHFMPRPHWLPWLRWEEDMSGLRLLRLKEDEGRAEFHRAMEEVIRYSRRAIPGANDFAMNALEQVLLWAHTSAAHESWRALDARIRQAVDHLAAHAAEPFHLEDLARRCGLSVSRLAHLFKQQTGTTPQRFVETQRLERAAQLLRLTNLSLAEIATEVGYGDAFYFSNRFTRHFQQRPSAFRAGEAIDAPNW